MKMEMKNRSHRFDMNRPRPRYRHRYTKYKLFHSRMLFICIRKHLNNIWSSFHEKIKQLWDWTERSVGYKKIVYFYTTFKLGSHCAINDDIWRYFFWRQCSGSSGNASVVRYCQISSSIFYWILDVIRRYR